MGLLPSRTRRAVLGVSSSPEFTWSTLVVETSMIVENRAYLPDEGFGPIAKTIGRHRSIKHALDWLTSLQPPLSFSDIVTQDEFSHDIIAAYHGGLYLVYDVT